MPHALRVNFENLATSKKRKTKRRKARDRCTRFVGKHVTGRRKRYQSY